MIPLLLLALAGGHPSTHHDPAPICPPNATMQSLADALSEANGSILGGAVYPAPGGATTIVIYEAAGATYVAGFKHGCAAMLPLKLETIEVRPGEGA